jgi:hypothetical protein
VNAELAQLRPKIARKGVAAVDLVRTRRNLVGGEAAHAVAQHVGGLAEPEIKAPDIVHAHSSRSRMDWAMKAAIEGRSSD